MVHKKESMNVLILGSGGREHAFAWKIAQSKRLTKLYVAPGNAGTAMIAENVPISVNEFEKIKKVRTRKKYSNGVGRARRPLSQWYLRLFSE